MSVRLVRFCSSFRLVYIEHHLLCSSSWNLYNLSEWSGLFQLSSSPPQSSWSLLMRRLSRKIYIKPSQPFPALTINLIQPKGSCNSEAKAVLRHHSELHQHRDHLHRLLRQHHRGGSRLPRQEEEGADRRGAGHRGPVAFQVHKYD